MTEWQDISTAPKERILATDGETVSCTYWCGWRSEWKCEADITTDWDNAVYVDWNPTHWMPLPAPPARLGTSFPGNETFDDEPGRA